MRIEILCTGDEILTGKTVNTNYGHIARRLVEVGLGVHWGTVVGDDREDLMKAFAQAAERADAVIVNGGLGPTVDDLSQEIAARAAGVELVLDEGWLARMEERYRQRGRVMPPNNVKQAMLPEGAELLDNPIGTACGFAVTIGKARFMFTPGVPREMRRMIDEQVLPRLLAMSGMQGVTRLKRFHSFGIGESRADAMLSDIPAFAEGSLKLGFQSHYPQLETKIAARAATPEELERLLAPVEAEVRRRLGSFILCEDDQTLEGTVLGALAARGGSLAVAETFTGGAISARLAALPDAERVFLRGAVARGIDQLRAAAGLEGGAGADELDARSAELASAIAVALRKASGASHALVVLVEPDRGDDRTELGGDIYIAIADAAGTVTRQARLTGGREWVRLGAAELGLDCLRRHLQGLPVEERIDFEKR